MFHVRYGTDPFSLVKRGSKCRYFRVNKYFQREVFSEYLCVQNLILSEDLSHRKCLGKLCMSNAKIQNSWRSSILKIYRDLTRRVKVCEIITSSTIMNPSNCKVAPWLLRLCVQ